MILDSRARLRRRAGSVAIAIGLAATLGIASGAGCGGGDTGSGGNPGSGGSGNGGPSTSNGGGSPPTTHEGGGGAGGMAGTGGKAGTGGTNSGGAGGSGGATSSSASSSSGSGGSAPAPVVATCPDGGTSLLSHLVGWWHGERSTKDAYGTNNGSVTGTAFSYSSVAGGGVGEAFNFGGFGTDARIVVPDSESLSPTKAITLEAWVHMSTAGRIFTKISNGQTNGYLLDVSAGKLRMIVGTHTLSSADDMPVNTWTHVAGVYDGTTMVVYMNGVAKGSLAVSGDAIPTNALDLVIGADEAGGNAFKGLLDELRIHDRGFSAGEIGTLYKAGLARSSQGSGTLLGWFSADGTNVDGDELGLLDGTAGPGVTAGAGILSKAQVFPGVANAFSRTANNGTLADLATTLAVGLDAWIKPTGTEGRIFDKMTPGTHDGFMLDLHGGKLRFIVGSSTLTSNSTVPTNVWTHVTASYKNALQIYIDGVAEGSLPSLDPLPTNSLPLTIGADSAGGSLFTGAIDEARIADHTLSAVDAISLYDETRCQ